MSCGCLNSELSKVRATKHGEDGSRLNACWKDMKKRARNREDCEVYLPWKDYNVFKVWAEMNGYNDNLILSRRLDTGDYCPENVLWVSKRRNTIEAHSYYWKITPPNSEPEIIYNMNLYAKSLNIPASTLSEIASGKYKGGKYEAWKVEKLRHGTTNKNLGKEQLDLIFKEEEY
jgi:hypothetical protein